MEPDVGGPRDHLANERTHLAWLRTGLTVMVLGLAVARYGNAGEVSVASVVSGAVLVLVGGSGIVYGTLRYRELARELERGEFETARSTTGPIIAAGVLLIVMLLAAVMLVIDGA